MSLSDTFLAGKIRASMLTDPGMGGADVSVNAEHGVVSLAGSVKTREQAALAD